jgi:major membrane immunogen (membrane-anchored lipoprotein)
MICNKVLFDIEREALCIESGEVAVSYLNPQADLLITAAQPCEASAVSFHTISNSLFTNYPFFGNHKIWDINSAVE